MTIQQAAQEAIQAQDGVNLSGIARSMVEAITEVIWPEARRLGKGTEFVNTHPIVSLYLEKLDSLNGTDGDSVRFRWAYKECKKLAKLDYE